MLKIQKNRLRIWKFSSHGMSIFEDWKIIFFGRLSARLQSRDNLKNSFSDTRVNTLRSDLKIQNSRFIILVFFHI